MSTGHPLASSRSVKIKVVHRTGEIETISLSTEGARFQTGQYLDRLVAGGMEYFFTKDGFYDGWGAGVTASPQEAAEVIDAIESRRDRQGRTELQAGGRPLRSTN